jgi:hypothetical protein
MSYGGAQDVLQMRKLPYPNWKQTLDFAAHYVDTG